jgi:hypothetical protein
VSEPSRQLESLGLNRTFLFLLVVGLFIVAWHRNRIEPASVPAATTAPAAGAKPAAAGPTNATADPNLVSVEQTIHK